MSNIKLDLKDFKYHSSDDKSTTLKHNKHGHMLTLAHNVLSPDNQSVLKAIAKVPQKEPSETEQKMDRPYGTIIHKMAEGGTPQGPCLNPNCKSHGKPHPNCRCYGAMAEGGTPEPICKMNGQHQKGCQYYAEGSDDIKAYNVPTIVEAASAPIQNQSIADKTSPEQDTARHQQQDASDAAFRKQNPSSAEDDDSGYSTFQRKGQAKGGLIPHSSPGTMSGNAPFAGGGRVNYAAGTPSGVIEDQDPESPAPASDDKEFDAKPKGDITKEFHETILPWIKKQMSATEQANGPQAQPMAPQGSMDQASTQPSPDQAQPQDMDRNSPAQAQPQQSQPEQSAAVQTPNGGMQPVKPEDYHAMIRNDLMGEDDAWNNDLQNGHISPETMEGLFAKKDTLGKIGTIFGLMLSGAGSGLAHQPNAMLGLMQKQIDNDLQAQTTSKNNAQNYLRLSQQHEMNRANIQNLDQDTAAKSTALAMQKMNRAGLTKLVKMTNDLQQGSPQRQQAENALAMMYQTVNNENFNIADRYAAAKTLANFGGNGQGSESGFQQQNQALRMSGNDKLADYKTDRHIPGVNGAASRPIPEDIRNNIQAQNVLDNKVRDVLNFAQQHRGSVDPSVLAQAKQKAEELTSFYNKSVDSLGMTQGRMGWLEEQIKKNPTSIIQQVLGNNARLREIRDSNVNRRDLQLKNLGFPIKGNQNQDQAQPAGTQSKSGRPMEQRNGKWYYK